MGDGLGLRRTWLVGDLPPAIAFTIVRWGGWPGASSLICQASSSVGLRVPWRGRGAGPGGLWTTAPDPPAQWAVGASLLAPGIRRGEGQQPAEAHKGSVPLLVLLLRFPL